MLWRCCRCCGRSVRALLSLVEGELRGVLGRTLESCFWTPFGDCRLMRNCSRFRTLHPPRNGVKRQKNNPSPRTRAVQCGVSERGACVARQPYRLGRGAGDSAVSPFVPFAFRQAFGRPYRTLSTVSRGGLSIPGTRWARGEIRPLVWARQSSGWVVRGILCSHRNRRDPRLYCFFRRGIRGEGRPSSGASEALRYCFLFRGVQGTPDRLSVPLNPYGSSRYSSSIAEINNLSSNRAARGAASAGTFPGNRPRTLRTGPRR